MSGGCVGDAVVLPGIEPRIRKRDDYHHGTHRLRFPMVVRVAERRPASAALPSPLSAIGVSSSVQIIHFVLARGNVA